MIKRPILVVAIGYLIGILMGLYFKFSIVLFYFPIVTSYFFIKKLKINSNKKQFKLISFYRYFRYIKLILNLKVISIIFISSIISNSIVLLQNKKYDSLYSDKQTLSLEGIIIGNKQEKEYKDVYLVKVKMCNESKKYENTYLYLNINKQSKECLSYGDKVILQGEFIEPDSQRNKGGYDYKQYLKTKKVYGSVNVKKIKVIDKHQTNMIFEIANNISLCLKEKIDETLNKDEAYILKGILLGDTSSIDEDTYERFQISNMAHILAVSGMHISYIILGIKLLLDKRVGKRKTKYCIIVILIFYLFITGFTPSVIRATIMGILVIASQIFYRKNDVWNSIALSLFCILLYNPFLIMNIGLQLSYFGTIGIILLQKNMFSILKNIKIENKKTRHTINRRLILLISKIKEILAVTLSAQIAIFPIIIYHFNFLGIYFLITNLLVSIIIGPVFLLGFICVIFSFFKNSIFSLLNSILSLFIKILIHITEFSKLPLSKIYIPTPKIYVIIVFYIVIVIFNIFYSIYHKKVVNNTERRTKNLIALMKFKFNQRRKKVIKMICILIIIISFSILFIPKNLRIHFVDVGQGDCTFIETPKNRTILIDGGGNITSQFDVGKKTLLPYILDRGYRKIDYMIISHFDQDHSLGCATIIENIKVSNIIISEQFEENDIYKQIVAMAKKKNIRIIYVKVGNQLNVDGIKITMLHPQTELISDNAINNNSIVCKVEYKSFSMLFTGDIEKEAEELILDKNINLKADILKIAHHRFKNINYNKFFKCCIT